MWKLTSALALGLAITSPVWAEQVDRWGYGWSPQTLYAQCQDGFYGACLRYDQLTGSHTAASAPQRTGNDVAEAPAAPLPARRAAPPAIGAISNDDLK